MLSLDGKIRDAIHEAVADAGQPDALARRLTAWMEAIASGNEDLHDSVTADRHLEILYAETAVLHASGEHIR